jgi:hypothetical protein
MAAKNVLCGTPHYWYDVANLVVVIFDEWKWIRNCNNDPTKTFLYLTVEFLRSRMNNIPKLFDDREKSNLSKCLEEIVAASTLYVKTPHRAFLKDGFLRQCSTRSKMLKYSTRAMLSYFTGLLSGR